MPPIINPESLSSRIVAAVEELGVATTFAVLAQVSKYLEASRCVIKARRAIRCDRKRYGPDRGQPYPPISQLVARGRLITVQESLKGLAQEGRIRRVRVGVYAPVKRRRKTVRTLGTAPRNCGHL